MVECNSLVFNFHIFVQPVRGEQGGREVILPNKCSLILRSARPAETGELAGYIQQQIIIIIMKGKLLSYSARTSLILSILAHQDFDITLNIKLK